MGVRLETSGETWIVERPRCASGPLDRTWIGDTAVWAVDTRARSWVCSSEKLRLAAHAEALGAEILDGRELGPTLKTTTQRSYNAGSWEKVCNVTSLVR